MTPIEACQKKTWYRSWDDGMQAILRRTDLLIPPRLYRCVICHRWHITSKTARRDAR